MPGLFCHVKIQIFIFCCVVAEYCDHMAVQINDLLMALDVSKTLRETAGTPCSSNPLECPFLHIILCYAKFHSFLQQCCYLIG
jgi:hypothetical protein